jgi:hypothetical protein
MKNNEGIHDMLIKKEKHEYRKGFVNASKEREALE